MTKAVRIHAYGGINELRLDDVPQADPGNGEVRVAVRAAGVNPADWKIRAGLVRQWVPVEMPVVIGADIAGVIDQVGNGVETFKTGDEVFGMIGFTGGYSESVVCRADSLAHKPETIDFIHSAAVPLACLTAWQAIDAAGLSARQTVMIHGASGGVGGFAVQIAAQRGASIIATASATNHAYLKTLGADRCLDYRTQNFEREVHDADVVLDMVGGDSPRRALQCLRPGGVVVSIAEPGLSQAPDDQDRRYAGIFVRCDGLQLGKIGRLIDAGAIRATVSAVFPLKEAARAHELIEKGHTRGKIVIKT